MSHRTFADPNSIEARQALLDNRSENRKRKRHRVTRRSVKRKLELKSKRKHKMTINNAKFARHMSAVRAFWAGQTDEHP